jgi:hypothetical protein
MTYRGRPNWPPVWTHGYATQVATIKGEVGILTHVIRNHETPTRCYLVIRHEDEVYTGALLFDAAQFCKQIETLLTGFLGYSIKEIGDLDLSYTL